MSTRLVLRRSPRLQLELIESRLLPGGVFGEMLLDPFGLQPDAFAAPEVNDALPSVAAVVPSALPVLVPGSASGAQQAALSVPLFQTPAVPEASADLTATIQRLGGPTVTELFLDQSNVVPAGSTFDAAVISVQSVAMTFTVGLEGLLAFVDLQIYKNTGTEGDVTFTIRPTKEDGAPVIDDALVLFETTIFLDDIPTIDNPFLEVPLTTIDVQAGKIAVAPGDVLGLTLAREGIGRPPWVTWRTGAANYEGGQPYVRPDSFSPWRALPTSDAGFQTYVEVPE